MIIQDKVEGFYFRNDYFAIAAPTKCGSSSVRQYLTSHYKHTGTTAGTLNLHNKIERVSSNELSPLLTWNDGSVPAAVVIRDPIHRWTSGVIEAVKYFTENGMGGTQTFEQHWNDHVGPMLMHFSNEPVEFKYILLENLPLVLQHNVHMNRSAVEDSDLFLKIKKIRDPLVRILYEKDREWLEEEKRMYDEMIGTMGKEMPTSQMKELIRMSNEQSVWN